MGLVSNVKLLFKLIECCYNSHSIISHTHTIHILFVLPIQKCIWTGIKWESERISKWHDSFYILHICKFRPWQILIPFYVQTKQKKNSIIPNTYAFQMYTYTHIIHLCDDFGQAKSIAKHGNNEHAKTSAKRWNGREKYVEWKRTVLYRYIAETTNTYANSSIYKIRRSWFCYVHRCVIVASSSTISSTAHFPFDHNWKVLC